MREVVDLTKDRILSAQRREEPLQSKSLRRRRSISAMFNREDVKDKSFCPPSEYLLDRHCHRCSKKLMLGINSKGGICSQCDEELLEEL